MWSDEAVLQALMEHGLSTGRRVGDSDRSYVVDDIRRAHGLLDVRITGYNGNSARFELALPSSGQPQPWLYVEPDDERDWVSQLFIWLDEQASTDGPYSFCRSTHKEWREVHLHGRRRLGGKR